MATIVTVVLQATVSLILHKGRELAADKLQEGDVTEQQFRNMIISEIDDIQSKLDGLARKVPLPGGGGGVLDISLGGEVRPGPSCPDPD